jgi:hypothetical protein
MYCHFSKDNEDQVGANEGEFIFFTSVMSFSAAEISLEVN